MKDDRSLIMIRYVLMLLGTTIFPFMLILIVMSGAQAIFGAGRDFNFYWNCSTLVSVGWFVYLTFCGY